MTRARHHHDRETRTRALGGAALALVMLAGCVGEPLSPEVAKLAAAARQDADAFLAVDCKLPPQVRQLGRRATFLSAARVIKTSAGDCETRGGEYILYDRADLGTALSYWMPDAQAGDPKAQTYVGEIFERGLGGTPPDHASAALWYRRAAEQGYGPAQINLGQLYELGRGVERDPTQALNWYRRASGLDATYVATGDVAGELTRLRQQVSERDTELDGVRRELREVQRQLERERDRRASTQATRQKEREELEATRRQLRQERKALAETRRQILPDAPELAAERERLAARAAELARLEASLATWRQQAENREASLAARERDQAMLQAELEAARRQLADTQATLAAGSEALAEEQARTGRTDAEREQELARLTRLLDARQAEISAREAQIEALKAGLGGKAATQNTRVQEALAEVREQLAAGQSALADEKRRLDGLAADLAARERAFAEKNAEVEAQLARLKEREQTLSGREQGLIEREQTLAARESELTRLDAGISKLNDEVKEKVAALATLLGGPGVAQGGQGGEVQLASASPTVGAGGPVIRLLDPTLDQPTRNTVPVIQVRNAVGSRMVVGQIEAPAGMTSLTINDRQQDWTEDGVFTAEVPLAANARTEVAIVAVDKAGRRGQLRFMLEPAVSAEATAGAEAATTVADSLPRVLGTTDIDFGRFHALVIGNNAYRHIPRLESARNDAEAVASVLAERYGFQVRKLMDADRYTLLSALNELRATLTDQDNLLIYYAGHGELDRINQRGHWLPVDAEADNTANWISNVEITDILNAMSARRVLVVADSCYSGTLTRSSLARLKAGMSPEARRTWLATLAPKRARVALSSGGLTPVLDQGGGKNSIFANALLDVLKDNNDILEGQRLYQQLTIRVTYAADAFRFEQVPQYSPIKYAGHDSGEFFLVPRI